MMVFHASHSSRSASLICAMPVILTPEEARGLAARAVGRGEGAAATVA
jgi:hypothetical protein